MTPIADMVEQMLVAGTPASTILLAIRTAETVTSRVTSRVTETLRSPAAIRQAAYRQNIKQNKVEAEANDAATTHNAEHNALRNAVTDHCDLTSLLPSLKGTSEEVSKRESARARGTRLEPGTPLSDLDRAAAIELGASADRLDAMWAEFVDYWIGIPGQRGTKLNWSATWRNRVREVISRGNRSHAKANSGNIQDESRKLSAAVNAFDKPIPSELRSGEGRPHVRLLSQG